MEVSGVTLVMPLPEIILIITQITVFVNPDPKLVHLFTAMWESFRKKFYLEDWEETWIGRRESITAFFMITNMRTLKVKSRLHNCVFAAVNHNYDHTQRTLKHRNTQNGSKSTNHKSQAMSF